MQNKNKITFALVVLEHRSNLSDFYKTRSSNESKRTKINTNFNFPKSNINIQLNLQNQNEHKRLWKQATETE